MGAEKYHLLKEKQGMFIKMIEKGFFYGGFF